MFRPSPSFVDMGLSSGLLQTHTLRYGLHYVAAYLDNVTFSLKLAALVTEGVFSRQISPASPPRTVATSTGKQAGADLC